MHRRRYGCYELLLFSVFHNFMPPVLFALPTLLGHIPILSNTLCHSILQELKIGPPAAVLPH